MKKTGYIVTLIFLSSKMIFGSGTLIHLHGVPCSGKTTLCKHLATHYPKTYLHTDRDVLSRELRKDLIERDLGCRPNSRRELKEMEALYEEKIGPVLRSTWDDAAQLIVTKGIREASKGYNVLLDGNIKQKLTRHVPTFNVLVYTPPEIIFAREATRSAMHNYPPRARAVLLRRIMDVFMKLYRFGQPQDRQKIAVWKSARVCSLLRNINLELGEKQQKMMYEERQKFIKHFRLRKLPRIAIIPRKKHSLILHGAQATPTELAQTLTSAIAKS